MGIFNSILVIILGFIILKYTPAIYRFMGQDPDAEKYLGGGGTFTFLKLFGVALIIGSILHLFGYF
ncbi:MAG: hypothetical protein COT91_00615 [Candidatus Doudnabacteria bacterium CG10_big_fil_rev_8_21_14_0_10_41_10]|uniref:Uncharacterized protein n=1 Tax=Candidatus Doudnabacteria bacterium CG10_big_fil_rev_8_21_14_0_10_41_10 TaxID=1974551 RepID=A0A2H0VH06_9BACT|nr:MAG: hypothetical protein COT91_00615 [Candidatus Doudnabacteria bacterium CG10_big_fil_rev_8_21_14_0_10_41_10]